MERIEKRSFSVIGKEGSTKDGPGFIQRLWKEANEHFPEVKELAKRDDHDKFVGFWGAMTDFTRSFHPWDEFKNGLYLAGVECKDDAEAPAGWVKWTIPGFVYLRIEANEGAFERGLDHLKQSGFKLAGAVHDFTDPQSGKNYMFFPIERLLES